MKRRLKIILTRIHIWIISAAPARLVFWWYNRRGRFRLLDNTGKLRWNRVTQSYDLEYFFKDMKYRVTELPPVMEPSVGETSSHALDRISQELFLKRNAAFLDGNPNFRALHTMREKEHENNE